MSKQLEIPFEEYADKRLTIPFEETEEEIAEVLQQEENIGSKKDCSEVIDID
jgi:hypothetical protein